MSDKDKRVTSRNQGEGDKQSAKRYNEAQQSFVHSSRGQAAIDEAGELTPEQVAEGKRAERAGKARAKGEDPAVRRQGTADK